MKKTLRPLGGHVLDIDPLEVSPDLLTLAHNVHTRKAFHTRIGGRRVAYPVDAGHAPVSALHLLNINLNTFNWWMLFGASSIWAVEGTNFYDISLVGQDTVAGVHEWSSTLLNGIPVFTNGKDALAFWTGDSSDDAAAVPGWPSATVCKFVVAFRFHLFALNIDGPSGVFDNLIMWSDATDPGALPGSWTPAPGNEAGSALLADTPGRCVTGLPLLQQLLIYKPESQYAVEYVGQQPDNIFTVRPISRAAGALGPHCVIEYGQNRHLVVGNDDVYLNDGVNIQSVADNKIKQYLANSIDETYAQNTFMIRDLNKRETWICVPETGSEFATVAHIWDEKRDTWTTRDLNQVRYGTTGYVTDESISDTWDDAVGVWDTDIATWNQGSVGSISRVVVVEELDLYVEDTNDLVSITARLIKQDLVFDDDTQRKLITRVWIEGAGMGLSAVQFRLGTRDSTDESIAWGALIARGSEGAPCEAEGRFISIEVLSTGTNTWTLNRVMFEVHYIGAH